MSKIWILLAGIGMGAILMFVSMQYHLVRATDGLHLVPKTSAHLGSVYTDVREFTFRDWQEHRDLVLAISNSGDAALQEQAAKGALGNTVEDAWNAWTKP